MPAAPFSSTPPLSIREPNDISNPLHQGGFIIHKVGFKSWDLFGGCWMDAKVQSAGCRVQGAGCGVIIVCTSTPRQPWIHHMQGEGCLQRVPRLSTNQRWFQVQSLPGSVTEPVKTLPVPSVSRGALCYQGGWIHLPAG